ncbi:MAG: 4Fe-4S binding protein [Planctomycetota bacterium]
MKLRTLVQAGFVALTLYGVFFVGANAERWCPFGGVEAIYTYATEGNLLCSLGVSNFYVMAAVLISVLLFRRAFCGYVCPIGAISEWVRKLGLSLGLKRRRIHRGPDAALSLLKYPVLAVILFFTWRTSELVFRGYDPCYALLGRHGEDITFWAYVISGAILLLSLAISVPFCRWLCPLAAVLNPFSRFGATRIVRDAATCTDCGKCAKVCPMAIPVDTAPAVTHARCTTCLDCVDACPSRKGVTSLTLRMPGSSGGGLRRAAVVAGLLLVLAASVSAAYLAPLPSFVWSRGEMPADTESVDLMIDGLACRGSANRLVYFLTREDDISIEGPIRVEAWPGPGFVRAVITWEAGATDPATVKAAIVEPCWDEVTERWREADFTIEGYDPLSFD